MKERIAKRINALKDKAACHIGHERDYTMGLGAINEEIDFLESLNVDTEPVPFIKQLATHYAAEGHHEFSKSLYEIANMVEAAAKMGVMVRKMNLRCAELKLDDIVKKRDELYSEILSLLRSDEEPSGPLYARWRQYVDAAVLLEL